MGVILTVCQDRVIVLFEVESAPQSEVQSALEQDIKNATVLIHLPLNPD